MTGSALSGFAVAMAINAVLPHFMISRLSIPIRLEWERGLLFNLPLGVLLIHEQLSELNRRAVFAFE
jgi:hypothetical protein